MGDAHLHEFLMKSRCASGLVHKLYHARSLKYAVSYLFPLAEKAAIIPEEREARIGRQIPVYVFEDGIIRNPFRMEFVCRLHSPYNRTELARNAQGIGVGKAKPDNAAQHYTSAFE